MASRPTRIKPSDHHTANETRDSGPSSNSHSLPALGFVVADAALTPLSANHEAIAILTCRGQDGSAQSLVEAFNRKIRPHLLRSNGVLAAMPLASGRRTYFCRAFRLNGNEPRSNNATFVIVLERGISGSFALSQVAEQFRFTRREREAVTLVLQGLSNKEVAVRMVISTNTVKTLLRLVMLKMEVSSRSAIVARIFGLSAPKSARSPMRWN